MCFLNNLFSLKFLEDLVDFKRGNNVKKENTV